MNLKRRNVLTAISASFLALFGQAAVAADVPLIKPTSYPHQKQLSNC